MRSNDENEERNRIILKINVIIERERGMLIECMSERDKEQIRKIARSRDKMKMKMKRRVKMM